MTKRTKLAAAVTTVAAVAALALPAASTLAAVAAHSHGSAPELAVKRSQPNGKTDVIKAMGNTQSNIAL